MTCLGDLKHAGFGCPRLYSYSIWKNDHEPNQVALIHMCLSHGDEPPHQIRSYTLLFLLFLCFLYIADPPLCTSAPMQPHAIVLALTQQLHSLHQTDLAYLMDTWFTIHMYLLLFLVSLTCPLLWFDQSQALTLHSQALSITLPYAHFLVFHSYLACLYLPFAQIIIREEPHNCLYQFPPELRFSTYALHRLALISHLFHITSHCHDPTVSTCLETIPYPQIAPLRAP